MKLGMAVDGKLRLQADGGVSCDVTGSAKPHPAGRGILGYAAVAFAARPGWGVRLDFDARTSRSCETNDSGEPTFDSVSSLVRTTLEWKSGSGRLSSKVAWEREGVVFPCRPSSDRDSRVVEGELRVVPTAAVSAQVGVSFVDRRYRIAPHKDSSTNASWCEVEVDPAGAGAEGKVRLEGRSVTYPGSSTRTYDQRSSEVALSWNPLSRLFVSLTLSHVDRDFPFAPEKDLTDREVSALLSMRDTLAGTITLKGTAFQRKVPASAQKEYTSHSIGTELESLVGDHLSLSAGCVLSKRIHKDPQERDGDYTEAEISWRVRYDLSKDAELVCEAEIERREYPFKETANTYGLTSGVTVVYRF
jgi:hypothetical protein